MLYTPAYTPLAERLRRGLCHIARVCPHCGEPLLRDPRGRRHCPSCRLGADTLRSRPATD